MKNKILFLFQILIVTVFTIVVTVFAADPGSSDDPVVSKSYVDTKIAELLKTLESGGTINVSGNTAATNNSKYVPVHVGVGEQLLGGEGTELILRVGRSFAVVPGTEALIDATAGTELKDKAEIKKSHILIVPRNDGRGVRVVEDAWFLVKGDYTISKVNK